jgi:hypothetical protein
MLNLEFEYEWINFTTINLTSSNYEGTQRICTVHRHCVAVR